MGLYGDAAHHMYPKFLGGCDDQTLVYLKSGAHTKARKCLANAAANGNVNDTEDMRAKWRTLSERQRRALLMKSARSAGIDNDVIRENIAGWMAGEKPGENRTQEPRQPRRTILPDGSEYKKKCRGGGTSLVDEPSRGPGAGGFAITGTLLVLHGYFAPKNVAAAMEGHTACREFVEMMASAATGFDAECKPYNCRNLESQHAYEVMKNCSLDIGVAINNDQGAVTALDIETASDKLKDSCKPCPATGTNTARSGQ
jgi:hypothetical protein